MRKLTLKQKTASEEPPRGPGKCPTPGCEELEDQWCHTSQCPGCVAAIYDCSNVFGLPPQLVSFLIDCSAGEATNLLYNLKHYSPTKRLEIKQQLEKLNLSLRTELKGFWLEVSW